MGRVITSRSLGSEMVSRLTWNASDVGSIPVLGTVLSFSSQNDIIIKQVETLVGTG